jgi:2-polyprenyl-6-methoxyphenol hydroxylase-like FAD-dependent oxidoreductase
MQETLLQHAAEAGAEVWRDAVMAALRPGIHPKADFLHDGETRPVRARLIVGTDGRESQPATLQELDRSRGPTEFFTEGLQLAGDLQIEHGLFFLHAGTGCGNILVQNRPGNFQAYLPQNTRMHCLGGSRGSAILQQR